MDKRYEIAGRGVALVIGCATFPTWNTYPGLFAALATGNPTLVKPHPNAVLPAAITVAILHDVLREQGLDPNVVSLALCPKTQDTQALATDPAVASIDFTGGPGFGAWLRDNARQARLYAELAGVNAVVIESTDDYQGLLKNLAFALSLYSGQMCTSPQNIFVPKGGIATNEGARSFDELSADLARAVTEFLADPRVANNVLGAVGSHETLARLDKAANAGRVVLASQSLSHPDYPKAQLRTPLIAALDQADAARYETECFGPVAYLIACDSADAALNTAEATLREQGGLTFGVYSTDSAYLDRAAAAALRARVPLSLNLTDGVYVNQSAAFSDYHATGGNPAANASYTTLGFVADRFVVVQRRWHIDE
jgi:phenylacetic acid degradation protein paaN